MFVQRRQRKIANYVKRLLTLGQIDCQQNKGEENPKRNRWLHLQPNVNVARYSVCPHGATVHKFLAERASSQTVLTEASRMSSRLC
jgi:hypothetical protein